VWHVGQVFAAVVVVVPVAALATQERNVLPACQTAAPEAACWGSVYNLQAQCNSSESRGGYSRPISRARIRPSRALRYHCFQTAIARVTALSTSRPWSAARRAACSMIAKVAVALRECSALTRAAGENAPPEPRRAGRRASRETRPHLLRFAAFPLSAGPPIATPGVSRETVKSCNAPDTRTL
jgi:hypothetical protein